MLRRRSGLSRRSGEREPGYGGGGSENVGLESGWSLVKAMAGARGGGMEMGALRTGPRGSGSGGPRPLSSVGGLAVSGCGRFGAAPVPVPVGDPAASGCKGFDAALGSTGEPAVSEALAILGAALELAGRGFLLIWFWLRPLSTLGRGSGSSGSSPGRLKWT